MADILPDKSASISLNNSSRDFGLDFRRLCRRRNGSSSLSADSLEVDADLALALSVDGLDAVADRREEKVDMNRKSLKAAEKSLKSI